MAFFARNQLKNSQKNLPQISERDFRTILGVFKNEALKDLSLDTVSSFLQPSLRHWLETASDCGKLWALKNGSRNHQLNCVSTTNSYSNRLKIGMLSPVLVRCFIFPTL